MSIKSNIQTLFLLPLALRASARTITYLSTKGGRSTALNPACAPGGNFDLTSQLEGCSGYTNSDYFYTDSEDDALVMKVPGSPAGSGCVTTSGSLHCRTEFRETNPSSWDPKPNRIRTYFPREADAAALPNRA
ncbi:hypothetical protein V501_09178, partial [Pseudogymnoascus sp. VKM F-4519 (FW-2642)]